MSDDWSTVSLGRDKALGREIEVLRQRYLEHSEMLEKMIAGAPSEHLAKEYVRLREEIDATVRKLDDLERGVGTAPQWSRPPTKAEPLPVTPAAEPDSAWSPATSELRPGPAATLPVETSTGTGTRILLIGLAGLAVLVILGFLVWRYLSGAPHRPQDRVTEVSPPVAATETAVRESPSPPSAVQVPTPAAAPAPLEIQPPSWDYGVVRKGTRQTHQFRVVNNGGAPVTLAVARSACRCLWFEHPAAIPAGGTATLTVTIDGARAKAGTVKELVKVSSKSDPATSADLSVSATVQ